MKKLSFFILFSLCILSFGNAFAEHSRDGQLIGDVEVRNTTRNTYSQLDSIYRNLDWNLSRIHSENDLYWYQNSAMNDLNQLRNNINSMENAIRNLRLTSGTVPAITIQPWSGKSYIVYRDFKKIYINAEVIAPGRTAIGLSLSFDGKYLRTIDDGISQSPNGVLFKEDFNDSWSHAQYSVEMEITFNTGERFVVTLPSYYVGPGVFSGQ